MLLVSFTSHDPRSDPACVVEPGVHPFVRHRTAVAFEKARQASDAQLNALASSGSLLVNEPLTSALLAKLRLAAARSRRLERGHWHLLDEQGLLPQKKTGVWVSRSGPSRTLLSLQDAWQTSGRPHPAI